MMMSEFIERTGFEPTVEEYRAIEDEYMGGNDDKDTFCKAWKKNGGIQRLTRARKTRIENLESNVRILEKEKAEIKEERNRIRGVFNDSKKMIEDLEKENASLKANLEYRTAKAEHIEKEIEELKARIAEYEKIKEQLDAVKNLIAVLSK
ncbi:MAG: hypothetical protein IKP95_09485 [Ruminococcus sp.]|nr:hypothetical protein [Ruminococcus sp.]